MAVQNFHGGRSGLGFDHGAEPFRPRRILAVADDDVAAGAVLGVVHQLGDGSGGMGFAPRFFGNMDGTLRRGIGNDADAQRLKQVLINLLSNAAKFTPSGSIKLTVAIDKQHQQLELSVSDTGCGIPPDKSEKVFERFEKLNEYSQGTGLGLAISRLIIENLGGKIWVDKDYTEGARFVFTHPLTKKE